MKNYMLSLLGLLLACAACHKEDQAKLTKCPDGGFALLDENYFLKPMRMATGSKIANNTQAKL